MLFILFQNLVIRHKSTIIKICSIAVIFLIIPSFLTIYGFSSEFVNFQQPYEISATHWLADVNVNKQLVSSDYDTMMIYSYFEQNSWPTGIVGDQEITQHIIPINNSNPFFTGNFMIRSIRQDIFRTNQLNPVSSSSTSYWQKVDCYMDSNYDLIYSNGYIEIYNK